MQRFALSHFGAQIRAKNREVVERGGEHTHQSVQLRASGLGDLRGCRRWHGTKTKAGYSSRQPNELPLFVRFWGFAEYGIYSRMESVGGR